MHAPFSSTAVDIPLAAEGGSIREAYPVYGRNPLAPVIADGSEMTLAKLNSKRSFSNTPQQRQCPQLWCRPISGILNAKRFLVDADESTRRIVIKSNVTAPREC
jgi:hypothetical protein